MYKYYLFGGRSYEKSKEIRAVNREYAVKKFKTEVLWPERYAQDKYVIKLEYNSALGFSIPVLKEGAKIAVYEKLEDEKEWDKKPSFYVSVSECVNVNYDKELLQEDVKKIEWSEDGGREGGLAGETALQISQGSKAKAREYILNIEKLKLELEKKIDALDEEVEQFNVIIERKLKQIAAIETYIGTNEEIYQLLRGKAASDEEPVYVFQQKCFMDEEVGLSEIDGKKYSQGIDYQDIEMFDKWFVKHYKRYMHYEKSVMAWQIKRKDKDYGDKWESMIANDYNQYTYFAIRNGDNVYRIWSGVRTPDVMFPRKKEFDLMIDKAVKSEYDEKKLRAYIEKHMYIFIALQGIVDRTDILGKNMSGVMNFIHPQLFDEKRIRLVRDAEPENWLLDGKLTWKEYLEENQNSIVEGSRVMVNRIFNSTDYYKEGYNYYKDEEYVQGQVFIAEDLKEDSAKLMYRSMYEHYDKIIDFIRLCGGKKIDGELQKIAKKRVHDKFVLQYDMAEKPKYVELLWGNYFIIWRDDEGYVNSVDKQGGIKSDCIIKCMEKKRDKIKYYAYDRGEGDEFKIYYRNDDTVYKGWNDYEGHKRINRKGVWFDRTQLLNIDNIAFDDIRYYLNNRLYRKDYLTMMPFLKRAYWYKKREAEYEEPFIKLVMGKTGAGRETVKEAVKWWKLKNKWRRFVSVDEAKAYRMVCAKIIKEKGLYNEC